MSWSTKFADPILIEGRKPLLTLLDAAHYIANLPKTKHDSPEWDTAAEAVQMAAEGRGPILHARIGMLRALNHGRVVVSEPRRKRARKFNIIES